IYTYNGLGLRTSMATVDGLWSYTYDAIGQLTRAVFTPNGSNPDSLSSQDLHYSYDAAGNRTQSVANGVVTTYSVNDRNEYISTVAIGSGTTTYQYDPNGNLISQTDGSSTIGYSYNLLNQLTGFRGTNRLP